MPYRPISFEDPVRDQMRASAQLAHLQQLMPQQPVAAPQPQPQPQPETVGSPGFSHQLVGMAGSMLPFLPQVMRAIPHPAAQIAASMAGGLLLPHLAQKVAPGMMNTIDRNPVASTVAAGLPIAAMMLRRGRAPVPVTPATAAGGGAPLVGPTTPPPVSPSAPGGAGAAMPSAPVTSTAIIPLGGVRSPAPVLPVRGHLPQVADLGRQVGVPQFTGGAPRGAMAGVPSAPFEMPAAVSTRHLGAPAALGTELRAMPDLSAMQPAEAAVRRNWLLTDNVVSPPSIPKYVMHESPAYGGQPLPMQAEIRPSQMRAVLPAGLAPEAPGFNRHVVTPAVFPHSVAELPRSTGVSANMLDNPDIARALSRQSNGRMARQRAPFGLTKLAKKK